MTNEQKKDEIKSELIQLNYFKTPDGRQLYELSVEELETLLKEVKKG
ncbi:Fur-regulated basic protein FbpA [Niallia sp. FSL R7-0271]